MGQGKHRKRSIMSETSLREMHISQVATPLFDNGRESPDASYAMGWFVQPYRGFRTVFHGGEFCGFRARLTFIPSESIGVALLTNHGSAPVRNIITFNALDRLLRLRSVPWNAREKKMIEQEKYSSPAQQEKTRRRSSQKPSHSLVSYAGHYEHPAYDRLSIFLQGSQLTASSGRRHFFLRHRHSDVFDVILASLGTEFGQASFVMDSKGRIESVALPLEPTVKEILFRRVEKKKRV